MEAGQGRLMIKSGDIRKAPGTAKVSRGSGQTLQRVRPQWRTQYPHQVGLAPHPDGAGLRAAPGATGAHQTQAHRRFLNLSIPDIQVHLGIGERNKCKPKNPVLKNAGRGTGQRPAAHRAVSASPH